MRTMARTKDVVLVRKASGAACASASVNARSTISIPALAGQPDHGLPGYAAEDVRFEVAGHHTARAIDDPGVGGGNPPVTLPSGSTNQAS